MTKSTGGRRSAISLILGGALFVLCAAPVDAQDRPVRWRRSAAAATVPVTVFHATQSANLPTAETLLRNEFQFEISHRFGTPVDGPDDSFFGLDGPVNLRLGLAWAPHDRVLLTLQRSNVRDNTDANLKVRLFEGGRGSLPFMVALLGGAAFNTELPDSDPAIDSPETQVYGQLILNALVGGRLALGAVPSLLRNPDIFSEDPTTAFALGLNAQAYLAERASLFAEWVLSEDHGPFTHDGATVGLELETGGHFFRILLTNQDRLNPAHVLAGSTHPFEGDELRLGFNITRLIHF